MGMQLVAMLEEANGDLEILGCGKVHFCQESDKDPVFMEFCP